MKIYRGVRHDVGNVAVVVTRSESGVAYHLEHIERHSPDGFEFGYGGSGPADLSLSILTDFLNGDRRSATIFYQDFKREFVAKWKGADFEISEDAIESWVKVKWAILHRDTGAVIPERFKYEGVKA